MTIIDFISLRKIYYLCQNSYNCLPKGALDWGLIVLYSNRSVLRIMMYHVWENISNFFGNFVEKVAHYLLDCYCSWKKWTWTKTIIRVYKGKKAVFLSQICFHSGTSIHWIFNFIKYFASGFLENSTELEDGISITPYSRPWCHMGFTIWIYIASMFDVLNEICDNQCKQHI